MRFYTLAILATTLLLAACSGARLYNQNFHQNYQHLELMAFHGGKDMRLDVIGNPGDGDPARLAASVADAMTGRNQGLPIRFTPYPTETPSAPTRMVLPAATG